jgi:dTDP-4-dehydrorhamnose reductase
VPIIHLSTHYVFDGLKSTPYLATDEARPNTVYGRSKLEGEEAVRQANPQHIIVRTGWVYSAHGRNFFTRVLDLASESKGPLDIVADQRGNPTYAPHLAKLLLALARHLLADTPRDRVWGSYHVAGAGTATWYELAQEISVNMESVGKPKIEVRPITTAQYRTVTKRPPNCTLNDNKFDATFSLRLPVWHQGVQAAVHVWNRATER